MSQVKLGRDPRSGRLTLVGSDPGGCVPLAPPRQYVGALMLVVQRDRGRRCVAARHRALGTARSRQ